jgi:GMP synthase (glutamine-hydrolysing)
MYLPVLILETGDPPPSIRARFGPFAHWIRTAAGLTAEAAAVCRVHDGDPLPEPGRVAACIISGSPANVTEALPWMAETAAWLRAAARAGKPLLGICFGHQLLAHAFGGVVDFNPKGREIGTVPVELRDGAADPLLAGLPRAFFAHTTHEQTVLKPPPGAAVLARSGRDDCQVLSIGERILGLQFHPEFSAAIMRAYIRERSEGVAASGLDPARLLTEVRPAPWARRVLRRFVRQALRADFARPVAENETVTAPSERSASRPFAPTPP